MAAMSGSPSTLPMKLSKSNGSTIGTSQPSTNNNQVPFKKASRSLLLTPFFPFFSFSCCLLLSFRILYLPKGDSTQDANQHKVRFTR
jgi:hypothetical protein